MTIKVFWQDPYLTELETTIKAVHGNQITLSDTIFHAFSERIEIFIQNSFLSTMEEK